MAISYKLYQENKKSSKYYKKWYARAVVDEVVGTGSLAELIQRNCSVKRSDVMAVLIELSEVMRDQLLAGNRVKIDGIGSFKASFSSLPADTPAGWSAATHVTGTRIIFIPERLRTRASGKYTRTAKALQGIEFKELRKYGTAQEKE